MMRRVPRWFNEQTRGHFHSMWPWAMSSLTAILYLYNREPFDEVASAVVTKMRKPLLKGTEWLERHDVDPENLVLDLPPDMIFGPLDLDQQMKFTLAALRCDNELADGYLTRMIIDHMDISLDPPVTSEDRLVKAGMKDLIDFAVQDFTDTRSGRKHKYFHPDTFLRMVNWIAPYPELNKYFVDKYNGVQLIFEALQYSKDDYARVIAMRSLTLFCFTQKNDGEIEKKIMQQNGVKAIVDCYKQTSGDPTDTRYLTLLLSSILRHFPKEGGKEFFASEGIQAAVNNLNIGRYKGFPQHLRVIHDAQKVPKEAWPNGVSPNARLVDADIIPVVFGILEAFPEFYEVVGDVLYLLNDLAPHTTPFSFLEYRALPILSKVYVKYMDDPVFQTDGTRKMMAKLAKMMMDDPTCKRCFDPSVASYQIQECMRTMNHLVDSDRDNKVTKLEGVKN